MGAIYKDTAGLKAVEVHYRTAPDSLNECRAASSTTACTIRCSRSAQQREGRLRMLAVSTGKRLQRSPDIPTMTESGVPMDLILWWAVMVPAATPKPIVDKINGGSPRSSAPRRPGSSSPIPAPIP